MAAARKAAATLSLSSHDALHGLARQFTSSLTLSSSSICRNFATSSRTWMPEAQPDASTSARKVSLSSIINDATPETASATSATAPPTFPTSPPNKSNGSRSIGYVSQRSSGPPAPYRLHAHCTKHNTILALTRDLPGNVQDYVETKDAKGMYNDLATNKGASTENVDPKILGQTVLRTSPGLLGLKKAQRGTFEAASRASIQMFTLISQLGTKDRTNKKGQKVRDLPPTSIELIFKGFGPGREALVASLNSTQGDQVRHKIRRITDATPIKIGGTRPKKRRKLSPPLDLGRRRK